MLKELSTDEASEQSQWLSAFWKGEPPLRLFLCFLWRHAMFELISLTERFLFSSDFRRRFLSLLSYQFGSFHPSLALSILQNKKSKEETSSKTLLLTNPITFPLRLTHLD